MGKKDSGLEQGPRSKRVNGWHKGSIEELPSGSLRWSVRVTYPDGTHERRRGTVRTQTEAQRAIIKAQQDALSGLRPVYDRLTVGEMVTEFMAGKRETWADKTAYNNEKLYQRHIAPRLAHLKAAGVTPKQLREYFAWLSTKRPRPDGKGDFLPLDYSGQRQMHVLLTGAYKRAIADGQLRDNPAQHARPVSPSKGGVGKNQGKVKHFTPEELGRFIDAAKEERTGGVLAFMGMTGLRIGEATGLSWEDLYEYPDAPGQFYVYVRRTWEEIGSTYQLGTPKTASSVRPVHLSPDALAVIEDMRRRVKLEANQATGYRGEGLAPHAPMFPAVDGRRLRHDVARDVMERICRAADLPLRSPHALRHSAGTFHLSEGVDPVTVAKHLGHAQVSTTLNIYAHALPSKLRGMGINRASLGGGPAKEEAGPHVEDLDVKAKAGTDEGAQVKRRAGLRPRKTVRRRNS